MSHFVAYYSSSLKQGKDLADQKKEVKTYLKDKGELVKSWTDIKVGKSASRPELNKALDYCQRYRATLIFAKIGSLLKDPSFISLMQEKKRISFVCCDRPYVTHENISLMGEIARSDGEQRSKKIKGALSKKRKAGVLLGSNNPTVQAGLQKWRQDRVLKKVQKVKEPKVKANKKELSDQRFVPPIQSFLNAGFSYKKVAYALNEAGSKTRQGKKWSAIQVFRVVKRNNLKRKGGGY